MSTNGPSPLFVRATIRVAHPEWTDEQVDAELQRKMAELANPKEEEDCLYCSA